MLRSELESNIKEKLLLEGLTSTGKTLLSMKIAKLYLLNNKKVLLIDSEHGTDREKKNIFGDLTDEQLEGLEIVHANDIDTFLRAMLGYIEEKTIGSQLVQIEHYKNFDLKVCDDLTSEIDLFKTKLYLKYIRQGKYEIGGKEFIIKDKDSWVLPFNYYARIYDQIKEALVTMLQDRNDLICTIHPLKESESQQNLQEAIYAKFDSVVKLQKTMQSGYPKWSATVVKNRGRESPDKSNTLESVDPLLIYFIKKFGMPVDETMKRLNKTKDKLKEEPIETESKNYQPETELRDEQTQ